MVTEMESLLVRTGRKNESQVKEIRKTKYTASDLLYL